MQFQQTSQVLFPHAALYSVPGEIWLSLNRKLSMTYLNSCHLKSWPPGNSYKKYMVYFILKSAFPRPGKEIFILFKSFQSKSLVEAAGSGARTVRVRRSCCTSPLCLQGALLAHKLDVICSVLIKTQKRKIRQIIKFCIRPSKCVQFYVFILFIRLFWIL